MAQDPARSDGRGGASGVWRQTLDMRFAANARRGWGEACVADTTGRALTRGRTLVAGILLARWLARHRVGERMIGVLLPASVGAALVNLSATLASRVPVNLNFTIGKAAMQQAVERCEIRTVITSRRFLEKAGLPDPPGRVFVEDILSDLGGASRLGALLLARFAPLGWLKRACGGAEKSPADLATVIFSSGSTGEPKGVMLSHQNILSNVDSLTRFFAFTAADCLIGVLPFFHSFGYTGTFWLPLLACFRVVYHPNPMDAQIIGELVEQHRATMLISTPTFFGSYLRRCTPEQFKSLRLPVVGAEKLRPALADAFRAKYGVELLEGYGCTEMAPVVAVNRPVDSDGTTSGIGSKTGSVGYPIPGVSAKAVGIDDGKDLPTGSEGLLLVRGAGLMLGYLGQPDLTADVIRNGWYVTGDIGLVDEDGFIHITDRLSRFSKIGGEMVPHGGLEASLRGLVADGTACVVTAVPDESRGERLVVFYTDSSVSPAQLWESLVRSELPKLWVPRKDDCHQITAIPVLGTGKTDLQAVRQLALDRE